MKNTYPHPPHQGIKNYELRIYRYESKDGYTNRFGARHYSRRVLCPRDVWETSDTTVSRAEKETDRERTEKSFFVPKQEIVGNDYDLAINKYKKVEYVPVEYPPTSEILAELKELQNQITIGLKELEGMV